MHGLALPRTVANNTNRMNDLDSISTLHKIAQKGTKTRYKVAPKAAPDSKVEAIAARSRRQARLVGIAITAQLEIIFDTVRSSRKYPNLIARPDCSFVVGWTGELQIDKHFNVIDPGYQQSELGVVPQSVIHRQVVN
jgi:hypothetical protein